MKNGLSTINQNKAAQDYINREKLIYKCYTCNKIGHLTKNCKLKDKLCPKCNNTNSSGTCSKAIWKHHFNTIDHLGYKVTQNNQIIRKLLQSPIKIASLTSFNSSKLKLAHINIRSCRNKEVEMSLLLKENDIDILSLNETWLKSNFKLDIPNYTIGLRDRLRRQGGVAILVRNDIKFDIIDPCSTLNTDNEAITIWLRNSQDSISISTIYIPPASTVSTTLLDNIKKIADIIIITGDLNAKHIDFNCT